MPTGTDDTRLIFPVGHLAGRTRGTGSTDDSGGGAGGAGWSVRIGDQLTGFASDADFTLWGLAHGDPDRVGLAPWTVTDVLTSADAAAVSADSGGFAPVVDAGTGIERLVAAGALAVATPGTLEASGFARTHQLVPLMHGLADRPSPDTYGLGITYASPPNAYLNEDLYVIWRLAAHTDSLLDLAERLSVQAIESGIDAAVAGVDVVLDDILTMLHVVLAQHAGYLDRAHP